MSLGRNRREGFGLVEAVVALLAGVLLLGGLLGGLMAFQRRLSAAVVSHGGADWPVAPSAAMTGRAARLHGVLAGFVGGGFVAVQPIRGGRAAGWSGALGTHLESEGGLSGLQGALASGLATLPSGAGELLWLSEAGGGRVRIETRLRLEVAVVEGWSLQSVLLERAGAETLAYRMAVRADAGGAAGIGLFRADRASGGFSGRVDTVPLVVVYPDPRVAPVGAFGRMSRGSGYVQALEVVVLP